MKRNLGTSLWSFSYQMTYPPMKWFDNEFLPGTPPDPVFDYLKTNLKRLKTESCTEAQLKGDFTVKDEWILPVGHPKADPWGLYSAVAKETQEQ